MAVLQGWSDRLLKDYPQKDVAILDQGPVYLIAELHHFNPNSLENSFENEWWLQIFDRWSASLDMIVWIDAPNEILASRISERAKWHMMKDKPQNEIFEVLNYHRAFYKEVITFFEKFVSKPKILCINSGCDELSVISEQLIQAIGL